MIGIPNIGNTCFINSGIIILYNVNVLKEYIINKNFNNSNKISNCNIKNKLYNELFLNLKLIFISLDTNSSDLREYIVKFCVTLQNLAKNKDSLAEDISNFSIHNDVDEFINYIIDKLEDFNFNDDIMIENSNQYYEKTFKRKTIINKCFKIQEATQQKCTNCNYLTKLNFNNYVNKIQLSISNESISSISDALHYFSNTKIMEEYNCEKCKTVSTAKERTIFSILPEYLIIQLLRFNNDGSKNNKSINIDKTLNFKNYSYNNLDIKYDLTSISCHLDFNHLSGHYISFVKNDNKWFIIDDDNVRVANNFNILTNNSYLLLYKKII